VWLERRDGATPSPRPLRGPVYLDQVEKSFVPHILPVTPGTRVVFRNKDPLFHNVFSLTRKSEFDSGLYKSPDSYTRTFRDPGVVQILCNIHASMSAYVVVVGSPWFGQADRDGSFTIRNVPPGRYQMVSWNESSSKPARQDVEVSADSRSVSVRVAGDATRPTFVPDKYGKPRQVQLGY
jgi:hypothetical protein